MVQQQMCLDVLNAAGTDVPWCNDMDCLKRRRNQTSPPLLIIVHNCPSTNSRSNNSSHRTTRALEFCQSEAAPLVTIPDRSDENQNPEAYR
ncbi:hypothetical protein COP2_006239 [Malus domestica]